VWCCGGVAGVLGVLEECREGVPARLSPGRLATISLLRGNHGGLHVEG
jgi:hypothetical protein